MNIAEMVIESQNLKTLLKVLRSLDLLGVLADPGPFTLFAPSDDAFARLQPEIIAILFKDCLLLNDVLTHHLISEKLLTSDFTKKAVVKSFKGRSLAFRKKGEEWRVDGAEILKGDIECTNGVIHIIDTVILLEEMQSAEAVHIKKSTQ